MPVPTAALPLTRIEWFGSARQSGTSPGLDNSCLECTVQAPASANRHQISATIGLSVLRGDRVQVKSLHASNLRWESGTAREGYAAGRDRGRVLAAVQAGASAVELQEDKAPKNDFQFVDEGETVEVRILLPEGAGDVGASQVAVNTHQDSLLVTLATEDKLVPLLVATPLYGAITAGDTVWFLDENEIVVNLEKVDKETPWPDLVQAMGSLARGVGVMLKSCSVNVVGESSEANWAVASELAAALGYVPMRMQRLVEGVTGKTVTELLAGEGPAELAEIEAQVLECLTTNVRCSVATMGGPHGAAASQDNASWRPLHAGVTVWLAFGQPSENDKMEAQKVEDSPYSRADVQVHLGLPSDQWHEGAARPTAEGVLRALKQLLEKDRELTGKKGLYLRLGCRGDWPEIMPPGWNPDSPNSPPSA